VVVVPGDTVIDLPVPMQDPEPQPPANHCQPAPEPKLPCTLSWAELPLHMVLDATFEVTPVGPQVTVFTVMVTLAQEVLLQLPSALTK
jgi:hypothetical protein